MAKITVYGMQLCSYCQDAKAYFAQEKLPFEYIEVDEPKIKDLEAKTGIDTVPQIFVNDTFVGGWITTKEKIESGDFAKLLIE